MPYIDEDERPELDIAIKNMIESILNDKTSISDPNDFSNFLGRINYSFSMILMGIMPSISYRNIAMATGVLENIKQEFYRRVAVHYENKKITENGDIVPYKV